VIPILELYKYCLDTFDVHMNITFCTLIVTVMHDYLVGSLSFLALIFIVITIFYCIIVVTKHMALS
jgi:hypothetical protein